MEDRRCKTQKKGISGLILFVVILAISNIYAIICLFYEQIAYQQDFIIKSWGCISILLLISSVAIIKKNDTIFNAYIIYIIVAYFYWLGSLFLKTLGLEPDTFVLSWFTFQELIRPVVYSVVGFGFLQLAAILYSRKKTNITAFCHNITIKNLAYKKAVLITSIILLIISTPVYYNNLIDNAIKSATHGYASLYVAGDSSSVSNIISSLKMFFIPGLYLFFSVKKESKIVCKFVSIVVIVNVILGFMTGSRSEAFILILSFLWLYHVQIKPFKRSNIIKLSIVAITLMLLSVAIMEYRGTANKTFSEFFNIVINAISKENFIVAFINELGYSIYPLIETMQIVPQVKGFSYGFSYLSSLLAITPKLFLGGFSFANYAALDIWLMNILNLNYGPGYSLIAETYYNFGWFGLILMMIWGNGLVQIFSNKFKGDKAIVKNAIIAVMIYYLLMTARSPLLLTFRNVFYGVMIPTLMINIIFGATKKRKIKNVSSTNRIK